MKRGLLGFPLFVFLIQVVSAQFFSGYGRFSIADFFNSIDPSTITLGLLFFIFFALIFYTLSRIFKDPYGQPNKGIAGTIAFAVSLLIIYGIYRSGFNLEDLFYGLGISTGALYLIASIILLIAAFLLIRKIRFYGFLIVFGLLLILLTIFTDIFYEKGTAILIGFILLIIGLLLWRWRRRRIGGPRQPREPSTRRLRPSRISLQSRRRGFQYSPGMKRGGLKPERDRSVSRRATERYARRFGARAARRRFGR